MSRPQTADSIMTSGLWLKGTATNLKPNDPMLIAGLEGNNRLVPLRVFEVTADPITERTHVSLRSWLDVNEAVKAVLVLAILHQTTVPSGSTGTQAAKDAIAILEKLRTESLNAEANPGKLAEFLDDPILPSLLKVDNSLPASATNLKPWLRTIIEELKSAGADLRVSIALDSHPASRKAIKVPPREETFFSSLKRAPSIPPLNASQLNRTLETAFQDGGDIFPRMVTTFQPALSGMLGPALANATVARPVEIKVYALRVSASLFAHNAPDQPLFNKHGKVYDFVPPKLANTWGDLVNLRDPSPLPVIALDAEYDQLKPESLMIVERIELLKSDRAVASGRIATTIRRRTNHKVLGVETTTMSAFGASGKVKLTQISRSWLSEEGPPELEVTLNSTPTLRGTRVYTQSELLPLAEIPLDGPICDAEIELDGLYDGLEAGRWVVISGKRADVFDAKKQQVEGIDSAELAMILSVSHRVFQVPGRNETLVPLPGDKTHTFIQLSIEPSYCYARDKMSIYGNVVKATHGETRKEVLGSGDASKPMQSFTLRQPPLTFLPAPTPAGAASTLVLRVNEVEWHETDTLAGLSPDDRKFVTKTDDESKTTVIFGNGWQGARPPTGRENIAAVYRNGIGEPGNLKVGQINQLTTRPLGVKEVINPLPSTGGANREGRDQVRKNAPLGVLALDRLVSVQDYADFARTFAGIGKASAIRLSDGAREIVHVTIAGANDIPIDPNSDLHKNLGRALRDLGDPHLPIEVELREMLSLVIKANVRVLPDYAWEFVEPKIRAALLDTFSFDRRELALDVTKSEVISTIQAVRGVSYVDLDCLTTVSEKMIEDELSRTTLDTGERPAKAEKGSKFFERLEKFSVNHRVVVEPARIERKTATSAARILPAQIAALLPTLSETLVLTEVKE
jgi:hypothetical protein